MNGSVKETLALMALIMFLCGGGIVVSTIFGPKAGAIFAGIVFLGYGCACLAAWYELHKAAQK